MYEWVRRYGTEGIFFVREVGWVDVWGEEGMGEVCFGKGGRRGGGEVEHFR